MRRLAKTLLIILVFIGCDNSEEPKVDCSKSDLSIEVSSSVKSDCQEPGSITVSASGGDGVYSYSLDGENFQSTEVFDNLFAGEFTIIVKDDQGCTSSVDFTLQSEPTGITLSLNATISDCLNNTGTITAEASGGVGNLALSLDDSDFSIDTFFESVSSGTHVVTVRDEEGCEVSKSILVSTNTSLSDDIMPIIQNDCAISGCHNGSQSPNLTTESAIIQNANRIRSETQSGSMPRNRTLSQAEIDLIACWVDDGAKNN